MPMKSRLARLVPRLVPGPPRLLRLSPVARVSLISLAILLTAMLAGGAPGAG